MHVNCECFQLNVFIQQIIFRHSVYETFSSPRRIQFPPTNRRGGARDTRYLCLPPLQTVDLLLHLDVTLSRRRFHVPSPPTIVVTAITVMMILLLLF